MGLYDEPVTPVIIKMSGFSEVKESAWQGMVQRVILRYSTDTFNKCKLQLCVHVNGWRGRSYISVELYHMKDPSVDDDSIKWPPVGFADLFRLNLLNQISNQEHRSCIIDFIHGRRPVHSGNPRSTYGVWWENNFISHEDFYKVTSTCQFLRDDCVFFRVSNFSQNLCNS